MNHSPLQTREPPEITRIKDVVARHPLPDFIHSFEVRFGEFADQPAMWITFKTDNDEALSMDELMTRVKTRIALTDAVQEDLLATIDDRWPYFRFERAD